MELATHVEIHHGRAAIHVIVFEHRVTLLHGFVHHCCYLQQFLYRVTGCFVKFLRVQDDSCFTRKKLANLANEIHTILLIFDVVTDVHLRIISLGEPVEYVGNELEIWVTEVLHGNIAVVAQRSHNFAEVSQISVRHFEFIPKMYGFIIINN